MPIWRNWARDQICTPTRIEAPRDEQELIHCVTSAAAAGLPVKAVGSGHSFTDAACTDGHMISLDHMASIVDVDRESGLVEVQGGIKLHELGRQLAEHGLGLVNQGDVAYQSIAGSISTGTHGTGLEFPSISNQVESMRIVTASGDVFVPDGDDLRAARIGVGALGVISTVTLRCVPTYTLRRIDDPLPLDEVLDSLDERNESNDHFEFFTWPYTRTAFTRTTQRLSDTPADPPSRAERFVKDVLVENFAIGFVNRGARIVPRATPQLVRTLPKLASREVRLDRSDLVFANPRWVRFTEMEYAIPRQHAAEAVRAVFDVVESRKLPVAFPLEVRFAPGDNAMLSSSYGRETCYIAVHVHRGQQFENYFRGVERIMDGYGGRPHWGKRHYQRAATLRERYPEWDAFAAVRARLDPHGTFRNHYLDRVLGPIGTPEPAAA